MVWFITHDSSDRVSMSPFRLSQRTSSLWQVQYQLLPRWKVLTKAPIFLLTSSPKDTPALPVTPILSSSSFSDSQPFPAVMQVGRAETTGSRSQQLCVRLCRAFLNYLPEERRCCQPETEEGARERDGRQWEDRKEEGMLTATGRENLGKQRNWRRIR